MLGTKYIENRKVGRLAGAAMFLLMAVSGANADVKAGLEALNAKNFEEAATLFSEAFEKGEPDGAFYLGRMLELGLGGPPDPNAAVGLYLAASAKGSAPAKNRLGVMHIQGSGVLQDYEEGAKLVCESADMDDTNGLFNCGNLLMEGKGIAKDEKKGMEYIAKAAEAGHIGAKNIYAEALMQGKLVEQNIPKAAEYFQQTAASGNAVGLFSLGIAFENGLGVDKDLEKAHSYYNLAAALNHPLAADARAKIEQSMTPEQILNAQRLAKAWRPEETQQSAEVELDKDEMQKGAAGKAEGGKKEMEKPEQKKQ